MICLKEEITNYGSQTFHCCVFHVQEISSSSFWEKSTNFSILVRKCPKITFPSLKNIQYPLTKLQYLNVKTAIQNKNRFFTFEIQSLHSESSQTEVATGNCYQERLLHREFCPVKKCYSGHVLCLQTD